MVSGEYSGVVFLSAHAHCVSAAIVTLVVLLSLSPSLAANDSCATPGATITLACSICLYSHQVIILDHITSPSLKARLASYSIEQ